MDAVIALAKEHGFEFVTTGGGCDGLARSLDKDYERMVLITAEDDPTQCPVDASKPVLLGVTDTDAPLTRFDDLESALKGWRECVSPADAEYGANQP